MFLDFQGTQNHDKETVDPMSQHWKPCIICWNKAHFGEGFLDQHHHHLVVTDSCWYGLDVVGAPRQGWDVVVNRDHRPFLANLWSRVKVTRVPVVLWMFPKILWWCGKFDLSEKKTGPATCNRRSWFRTSLPPTEFPAFGTQAKRLSHLNQTTFILQQSEASWVLKTWSLK